MELDRYIELKGKNLVTVEKIPDEPRGKPRNGILIISDKFDPLTGEVNGVERLETNLEVIKSRIASTQKTLDALTAIKKDIEDL